MSYAILHIVARFLPDQITSIPFYIPIRIKHNRVILTTLHGRLPPTPRSQTPLSRLPPRGSHP